jgi:hypothetical protein
MHIFTFCDAFHVLLIPCDNSGAQLSVSWAETLSCIMGSVDGSTAGAGPYSIHNDIAEVLFTEQQIKEATAKLGRWALPLSTHGRNFWI